MLCMRQAVVWIITPNELARRGLVPWWAGDTTTGGPEWPGSQRWLAPKFYGNIPPKPPNPPQVCIHHFIRPVCKWAKITSFVLDSKHTNNCVIPKARALVARRQGGVLANSWCQSRLTSPYMVSLCGRNTTRCTVDDRNGDGKEIWWYVKLNELLPLS